MSIWFVCFISPFTVLPTLGGKASLWVQTSKTSCAEIMLFFLHIILFVWKTFLNERLKTEIKIKQTGRRVKFEDAQRSVHIVYHPTPGHLLPHQKACCKRRFTHMSHRFLPFFFLQTEISVDERQPFCYLHWNVLSLPGSFLNLAAAWSSIHICCLSRFFSVTLPPFVFPPSPCHLTTKRVFVISVWCVKYEQSGL